MARCLGPIAVLKTPMKIEILLGGCHVRTLTDMFSQIALRLEVEITYFVMCSSSQKRGRNAPFWAAAELYFLIMGIPAGMPASDSCRCGARVTRILRNYLRNWVQWCAAYRIFPPSSPKYSRPAQCGLLAQKEDLYRRLAPKVNWLDYLAFLIALIHCFPVNAPPLLPS